MDGCRTGDYTAAPQAARDSLAIYQELGDKPGQATLLMVMGHRQGGYLDQREEATARRAYYEQALALQRELDDRPGIAECLMHLGDLARREGEAARAQELSEEALGLHRALGNKHGVALALRSLADLAVDREDYGAARPLLEEAASIHRELGDKRRLVDFLQALANQALAQGDVARARKAYDEAAVLCRELDDQIQLGHLLMLGGHFLLEEGEFGAARARYEEGLAFRRKVGDRYNIDRFGIGWALLELGHAAWCERDWKSARAYAAEAAELFALGEDPESLLAALESLAAVEAGQGQEDRNQKRMSRAARLFAMAQGLRQSQSLRLAVIIYWRRSRARLLAAAREVLEDEAYAGVREQGQAMNLEQALAYALAEDG